MNLSKSFEFLRPDAVTERIHIIGCGAVGSTLAENLARFGITKITLHDFDIVEEKNVANQMYTNEDVGKPKVEALADILKRINPMISTDLRTNPKGWTPDTKLTGYVFLCVDSIELRKNIAQVCVANPLVKAIYDYRIGLETAQAYATDKTPAMIKRFTASMNFTDAEAKESMPVSACNETLSVCPTIRTIVAAGVANFVNFIKGGKMHGMIQIDAFSFQMLAM